MHYVTTVIDPSEPCYGIWEGPEMRMQPDGSNDWRWIQKVFVIRDDTISKYETDFGSADDYELVTPYLAPSSGENSVAALQYMAERNREDTYWQKRAQEQQAESTLIEDHIRQWEQIHEIIRNRSTFGKGGHVQRNGYSSVALERELMARKREATGRIQIR